MCAKQSRFAQRANSARCVSFGGRPTSHRWMVGWGAFVGLGGVIVRGLGAGIFGYASKRLAPQLLGARSGCWRRCWLNTAVGPLSYSGASPVAPRRGPPDFFKMR